MGAAQPVTEHLVVDAAIDIVAALDAVAGKAGVIAGEAHLGIAVVKVVDSRLYPHPFVYVLREEHPLVDGLHLCGDVPLAADVADKKVVIGEPCGGAVVKDLVAVHVHDEDVVEAHAVLPVQQVAEVLDIAHVPLLAELY